MKTLNKREFIKLGILGAGGFLYNRSLAYCTLATPPLAKHTREGMFYITTPRGVQCAICPNECNIAEGMYGICRKRTNRNNKLYTIGFGNPCAVHVDPIEKKPFYHYYPGSTAYSVGVAGCNFACLNCLNWEISQTSPAQTRNYDLPPETVVEECLSHQSKSIAYTYTEPTTFYEYIYETAKLAKAEGIKNLMVSNGYINDTPLRKLCKVIDAASIDLKSFSNKIYQQLNGGKLDPILNTLKVMKEEGIWLEISNLIVTTWTDNFDMIKQMCEWLVSNGFENNPFHFIQFQPMYKLTALPQTPVETMVQARKIAIAAGLKHIYVGNIPVSNAENTICPNCRKTLIQRKGFTLLSNHLDKGKCKWCQTTINGVWE
jgi:pyruvate formate lyase activating enzyme